MSFYPGQLVVCIDDSPGRISHAKHFSRGTIYTISEFMSASGPFPDVVQIVEVPPPNKSTDWVAASRFRPLNDAKLAIFRKLLTDIPVDEKERA